jgi:pimeloyl-ACP methyl ester carboxylesterase
MIVRDDPKRPTIVFLHFFGGSARSWEGVLNELGEDFLTLALDLPGFGAAAGASGPFTIAAYADWVEEVVSAQKLDHYVLVGHSMGGKVALALAARRPPALRALVLLAPSPPTPEPIEEQMRAKLIAGWGCYGPASETLARVTRRCIEGELRERTIADMMNASKGAWTAWLQHGSREEISAVMQRIEVPVTIMSGDGDAAIPRDLIEREIVARLPQARLISVPGAGHLLPLEAPAAVAGIIERSLEEPAFASQEREQREIAMIGA